MSSRTIEITEDIYPYLLENIRAESPAAVELREATQRESGAHVMQISPEQGALMSLLVRILNARKTIEVGTFTGYSALVVAEALPADGKVIACDVSEDWTRMAREYWQKGGVADKIQLELRPATETIDALIQDEQAGSFDFAFIDADKANYDAYYEGCLVLLRTGGVVAVDNVLWSGRVAQKIAVDNATRSIRALNKKIVADDRVISTMLPIGDGLTLAIKQ